MSVQQTIYDDEISIIEIILKLWARKGFILIFSLVGVALIGIYLLSVPPKYTSRMAYKLVNVSALSQSDVSRMSASKDLHLDLYRDFSVAFFNAATFNTWAKTQSDMVTTYQDIGPVERDGAFTVSKPSKERLVVFSVDRLKENYSIVVRSQDLQVLMDVYNYARHVDDVLSQRYIAEAEQALISMTGFLENSGNSDTGPVEKMTQVKTYLNRMQNSGDTFQVSLPQRPNRVGTSPIMLLILGAVLGGMAASFYILITSAFRKHLEQAAQ